MNFTKEQISELMCKQAQKENGLQDLFEIMLESMMVAERGEFLSENQWDKGNGFRQGHTCGHGKRLEFRIPRDRYGSFHPCIGGFLVLVSNHYACIQVFMDERYYSPILYPFR